ncbi:MAG: MoaD/ThiS family protein [Peptococcaceae bacterium]|nr:MoaD/ThiS family protein [Peptococcaceae bacterium]
MKEQESKCNEVEVRAFSFIKEIFDRRQWPSPMRVKLEKECSATELARQMQIPLDRIEAVFVNGVARPLNEARIRPGDRVAFIPPGTPGPYRVLLGIARISGAKNRQ